MINWIELTTVGGKLISLPYTLVQTVIETDLGADVYISDSVYYSVTENYNEVRLRIDNADVAVKASSFELDQTSAIADAQELMFEIGQGTYPSTLQQILTLITTLILRAQASERPNGI